MASLSDILTAAKNLVAAVNGASQTYLGINGAQTLAKITSATVVQTGGGRVATVSIVVAGSAAGTIYDASATTDTTRPIYTIPATLGVVYLNMPVSYGIVVAPGTGQTISISYS